MEGAMEKTLEQGSLGASACRLLDTLSYGLEKVFSGKFVLCMAAAYCLVWVVERGEQVDPFVASVISSVVTFYFTKEHASVAASSGGMLK
jgi:hypothetical protein